MNSKNTLLSAAGLLSFCLLTLGVVEANNASELPWLRIVSEKNYDGESDDLVTAGLGISALINENAPKFLDPLAPTAEELRRSSLFTKGTAGFGITYGPNVDASTGSLLNQELIGGSEIIAYADDGSGGENVSLLLQVPEHFDWQTPCILAVPVAGSASLFRDVATIGYWGLQKQCAVTYTDKGLGNGFHDLETDTVTRFDGIHLPANEAGQDSLFTADMTSDQRHRFLSDYPHRIAFKHAHSRQNPDASWGQDVLRSIQFALFQLNQIRPDEANELDAANTMVMVAGNSNGGGAALYAGESDREGLIDGIVAAQPQVQLQPDERVSVVRGERTMTGTGRSLMDYFTYAILYQPCAAVATPDAPMRQTITQAEQRCQSLKERGLLHAETLSAQGYEALENLQMYGWEPESGLLHASHYAIAPTATAVKYASSHGRFGVEERLCRYSFASVDEHGTPRAVPREELAVIFSTAPGGAPAGSVDIINDANPGGPMKDSLSSSPSSGRQDYNLDGALCLRELIVGDSEDALRVQAGIADVQGSANLGGISTIIVHGRSDARVPVGFTSRPYLALNSLTDPQPNVHLYELTNVEHFGAKLPGYAENFVPIQPYHIEALEIMYDHLRHGTPLPPSQVIRPVPGENSGSGNLQQPGILMQPQAGDIIHTREGHVTIPD
ncbi:MULTISPECIES: 3-hydroxybutyrate oligomer hydrolase family protein [Halomonas]|uniref:3-hydroxybutyrate oligomer hydrolase family protein n=1 Tax=Halomonas TaxID=2745 RepID=UPI001865BEBB|nr:MULTISPECIES: 3-hydroxybutyrate oligomer hydrolase family protein [Halomonas]